MWKRAKYFIITADRDFRTLDFRPEIIRQHVLLEKQGKQHAGQLNLFG